MKIQTATIWVVNGVEYWNQPEAISAAAGVATIYLKPIWIYNSIRYESLASAQDARWVHTMERLREILFREADLSEMQMDIALENIMNDKQTVSSLLDW